MGPLGLSSPTAQLVMREPKDRNAYTGLSVVEPYELMQIDKSSIKITSVQNSINLLTGNGRNGRL